MAIDKALYLFSDTRALRLSYFTDTTKYVDFVTTSAGGMTVTPTVAGQTISLANTAALSIGGTLAVTGAVTLTVPLTVANGGTGLATFTAAGRLVYSTAATTLATLAIGTVGKFLRSDGSAPTWATATIPDTAAAGDLLYASASNTWTSLAKGTARQLLQTNAGATAPEWASNIDVPGTLDVTGAVVLDSTLAVTGVSTFTGNILGVGASWSIMQSTTDSNDSGRVRISGGGAVSVARGAYLDIFGNESAGTGRLDLAAGNVAGGDIVLYTGNLVERMRVDEAGSIYINDSSNANMTLGLTINQGANDNEIWTLKSSDVVHTSTTDTEADTYAFAKKWSPSQGGLRIDGYSEGTVGVGLTGVSTSADTAKNTSAVAPVTVRGTTISGTAQGDVGANGNLMVIRDNNTTRFIFDAEGDGHADVSWTTFDQHPDLALIEDMETLLAPGHVQRRFGEMVRHDRAFFEREGLLHAVREVAPGKMRGMLNTTRAHMLAFGAIRQVGGDVAALRSAFVHLLDNPNDRDGALRLLEA